MSAPCHHVCRLRQMAPGRNAGTGQPNVQPKAGEMHSRRRWGRAFTELAATGIGPPPRPRPRCSSPRGSAARPPCRRLPVAPRPTPLRSLSLEPPKTTQPEIDDALVCRLHRDDPALSPGPRCQGFVSWWMVLIVFLQQEIRVLLSDRSVSGTGVGSDATVAGKTNWIQPERALSICAGERDVPGGSVPSSGVKVEWSPPQLRSTEWVCGQSVADEKRRHVRRRARGRRTRPRPDTTTPCVAPADGYHVTRTSLLYATRLPTHLRPGVRTSGHVLRGSFACRLPQRLHEEHSGEPAGRRRPRARCQGSAACPPRRFPRPRRSLTLGAARRHRPVFQSSRRENRFMDILGEILKQVLKARGPTAAAAAAGSAAAPAAAQAPPTCPPATTSPKSSSRSSAAAAPKLPDVVKQFEEKGLRDEVDSWVRTGPNKPVDRRQIEDVRSAGARRNRPPAEHRPRAAGRSAQPLHPKIIFDELTPQGQLQGRR